MQGERVDAYYRLSMMDGDVVEENGKMESCSISSQRACIRACAMARIGENCQIVEHIDDGYTGTNFDRPGFRHLMQEVQKGNVRTIIAKDFSRLGRNWLEVGYYLEKVFPSHGIRVILVNEGYDSEQLGETTLEMGNVIKNLVNEWYSRDISRKIKSVVDIKKLSGEFVYGWAPFGYRKVQGENRIQVDEPAAGTVRMIFELANQGKTISQIAQELNERKVVTPSVYLADIRKNYKIREFWTYESVRNIITNRIYTGDTEAFKSSVVQVGSKRVKSIPWEERPVIEHTHTPIITREMYFGARQMIRSNTKSPKQTGTDLLSGYLVCGCCGNRLSSGRLSNRSYRCASARYNPEAQCSKVKISKEKMADILLHSIQVQIQIADRRQKEMEHAGKIIDAGRKRAERELRQVESRMENSQEQSMALYEQFVDGKLSKEEFQEKKKKLGGDYALWEKRKAELQNQLLLDDPGTEEQKVLKEQVKKYWNLEKLDRSILREFVKEVTVMPDQSVQIQWNYRISEVG